MTEFEKMQRGLPYSPADEELTLFRYAARRLCQQFNRIDPEDADNLAIVTTKLFAGIGSNVDIDAPFFCHYGMNIEIGDNVSIGPNCTMLDGAHVRIGHNVSIGPNVGIYTTRHRVLPLDITRGECETSQSVIVGNNVIIEGNTVIKAGVAIGEGVVIEAGSVVDTDIEPFSIVAGNPAEVVRRLQ
ncbi:sugar O-acetyltransferase [Salinivibrio proteolyticus]|uniref:Sugar O-acetyltransferase n=1 Tax=Salinivibrio proteolyticus TaxID=334715 RepID=A0ABY7LKC0_9GAMM|nr:sugar O-acetyltransferase [Salinivibrio proteolyticus]WBA15945.1 sugar O-acetyltransferase [Salinivibrio proteolyticus]